VKFLCIECDRQMTFEEREIPGDGTLAAVFRCPKCERTMAMLTNPMETQLVSSLGVKVGGKTVPDAAFEGIRTGVSSGREDAFVDVPVAARGPAQGPAQGPVQGPVRWTVDAVERLSHVPSFVRGMVKKIYGEYAKEHGIGEITPAVMDQARSDLGLEDM